MRPPEHWHLRTTGRSKPPYLAIGGGVTLLSIIVLLVAVCGSGGGAGSGEESDVAAATLVPTQPPVLISGRAAAIIEGECGALVYGQREHERLPPASLTKIATALVAAERADLDRVVQIDVNSALLVVSTDSTVMGLETGMEMSLRDLLHGLLLVSGNDAAVEIAEEVGGTLRNFIDLMNAKAVQLGLTNTHFANPHGLDEPGLYSSAYDMAQLGRALLDEPELAAVVAKPRYEMNNGEVLLNGNRMLTEYPDTVGVKTGYTEDAGQTLVAAAERNGRLLIVSVLGSRDRFADAVALLDWAFYDTESACDDAELLDAS